MGEIQIQTLPHSVRWPAILILLVHRLSVIITSSRHRCGGGGGAPGLRRAEPGREPVSRLHAVLQLHALPSGERLPEALQVSAVRGMPV